MRFYPPQAGKPDGVGKTPKKQGHCYGIHLDVDIGFFRAVVRRVAPWPPIPDPSPTQTLSLHTLSFKTKADY